MAAKDSTVLMHQLQTRGSVSSSVDYAEKIAKRTARTSVADALFDAGHYQSSRQLRRLTRWHKFDSYVGALKAAPKIQAVSRVLQAFEYVEYARMGGDREHAYTLAHDALNYAIAANENR